jgi:predicted short-subunit dehydrogenase-like oxidoreductase (DUF2520 family)
VSLPRAAAVLGLGAVGSALVEELPRAGVPVSLAWERLAGPPPDSIREASLVLLAVPDAAVEPLCAQLAEQRLLGRGQLVVHLAGALPLAPLQAARDLGAQIGSLHPLRAFVRGGPTSFAGAACGVAGSTRAAVATLRALAAALGMAPLPVPDEARALYHAAAVLSAGGEVALFAAAAAAFKSATGATEAQARAALLPLTLNAVEKLRERTPAQALTGPVARGDAATVEAHRAALGTALLPLYDALSRIAIGLAREGRRAPGPALDAVERALNVSGPPSASRGPRSRSSGPRPRRPAPASPAASSRPPGRSGRPPAPRPRGRATRRPK